MPDFLNHLNPKVRRLHRLGKLIDTLYIIVCIVGAAYLLLDNPHAVYVVAFILIAIGIVCLAITRRISSIVRSHAMSQGHVYSYVMEELISEVSGRVNMLTIERPEIKRFQNLVLQTTGPLSPREVKLLHMLNRCPETTVVTVLGTIFRHLLNRVRSEPVEHGDLLKKLYNRWAVMPYEKKLNAIVLGDE